MLRRPNKNLIKLFFNKDKINNYKRKGFILGIDDDFLFLQEIKIKYY